MVKSSNKAKTTSAYPDISRTVPAFTKILLVARAAGQCQFPGCRRYLFEHHLTLQAGNFAEFAHIIGFKPKGPRGGDATDRKRIHDVANLMLLCPEDHKMIDDHSDEYPTDALEKQKADHEARVRHLIGLGPEMQTVLLQLKCRIAGQVVDIPVDDIVSAPAPRYPVSKPGTVIDLNELDTDEQTFYELASERIQRRVREFYEREDVEHVRHASVFALGPIPLLMILGNALSSTVPVDLFQRHRDPETWQWKEDGELVEFALTQIQAGTNLESVALLLSLSGKVHVEGLPAEIDSAFTIYEIHPKGREPNAMLLRRREDVENFKPVYHEFLGKITSVHPALKTIDVFPAVPASIAVVCGRELLRKKHPTLMVWDLKKKTNQYVRTIKVN